MNQQPENHVRSGEWTIEDGAKGPLIPVNYSIALNGEAIGSVGLAFGTDVYFRSAEVGYWIGEEFWGRGIMGKVVPAFVKWSWKTFGILIRLNSEANDNNPGSIRTLVKAGFVHEGKKPNAVFKNGKVLGLETFGLLRPED